MIFGSQYFQQSSWKGDSKEQTWENTDIRITITEKCFGWMRNLTKEKNQKYIIYVFGRLISL